jgi:hypothetical protein
VFANIDAETGKLASSKSKHTVREAFREGTEPGQVANTDAPSNEDKNFFKDELREDSGN